MAGLVETRDATRLAALDASHIQCLRELANTPSPPTTAGLEHRSPRRDLIDRTHRDETGAGQAHRAGRRPATRRERNRRLHLGLPSWPSCVPRVAGATAPASSDASAAREAGQGRASPADTYADAKSADLERVLADHLRGVSPVSGASMCSISHRDARSGELPLIGSAGVCCRIRLRLALSGPYGG
jgi:hypothetical protein